MEVIAETPGEKDKEVTTHYEIVTSRGHYVGRSATLKMAMKMVESASEDIQLKIKLVTVTKEEI